MKFAVTVATYTRNLWKRRAPTSKCTRELGCTVASQGACFVVLVGTVFFGFWLLDDSLDVLSISGMNSLGSDLSMAMLKPESHPPSTERWNGIPKERRCAFQVSDSLPSAGVAAMDSVQSALTVFVPVILTYREQEIARRIVLVFKQWICGFDILRVQEGHAIVSYVCDVNGFSFVKNSRKYYDDCAQILSGRILSAVKPTALKKFSILDPLATTGFNRVDEAVEEKKGETSFLSRAARMLQGEPVHEDDDDECDRSVAAQSVENGGSVSPSRPPDTLDTALAATTLIEGALPVREFSNSLMSEPASISQSTIASEISVGNIDLHRRGTRSGSITQWSHQEELRCVLAIIRHGDRTPKQKLKLNMSEPHILRYFHDHVKDCKNDLKVKAKAPMTEFLQTVKTTLSELERSPANESLRYELLHMRDILERWKIVGLNRKLQIKPRKFEEYVDDNGETRERCTSVQLILKWGGNLTRLGEKQSINLGQRLRHEMYPDANGGGILRLHSTFRHDLKIKTSDEGRVMKTAAAFAKGLLELEGDLPPILVSLVHKEKGSMHTLDPSGNKEVKLELDVCKEKITANLQRDIDINSASEEDLEQLAGPKEIKSIRNALSALGNPRKALAMIHQIMGELIAQLDEMLGAMGSGDETRIEGGEGLKGEADEDLALSGVKLYKGETLLELTERWRFIYDRLYDAETDTYDLSRIPDVHDNVRFE
jgi:inositol-hexakisphosphate/diphosphoinositol-pentakisphosphate 1-kinase